MDGWDGVLRDTPLFGLDRDVWLKQGMVFRPLCPERGIFTGNFMQFWPKQVWLMGEGLRAQPLCWKLLDCNKK